MDTGLAKIQSLLQQVQVLVSKEKAIQHEKYRRGESFNIFKVCGVNHYEVTHSSILAEFLNPCGTHGQGMDFLNEFLKTNGLCNFVFADKDGVVVETEHAFSIKTKEGEYTGRIDILIHDSKKAIIIENKIYAQDQYNQLSRYETYAKERYPDNYKIIYLTLDQHDPNDESSKKVSYIPISYSEHIIAWLTSCKNITIDKPLIRESLTQYIQHIKELTNTIDMDAETNNELMKILISNLSATNQIIQMQGEIEMHVVKKHIIPLLESLRGRYGKEISLITNFSPKEQYCGFKFNGATENWSISFQFQGSKSAPWTEMIVGLQHIDNRTYTIQTKQLPILKSRPNEWWPYGYSYLNKYRNWDLSTMNDIINKPDEFIDYLDDILTSIIRDFK